MNQNLKPLFQATLLLFLGLCSVVDVEAQTTGNGDLIAGFTVTSGNDYIYDLGQASAITNGETWNLSTPLAQYTLSSIQWGVIGGQAPVGGTGYAWTTLAPGSLAPMALTKNQWNPNIGTPLGNIFQNFSSTGAGQAISISSSDDNSWYTQTLNPNHPTDWANTYSNPNMQGATTENFYKTTATGSTPTVVPVILGSFTLSSGKILTYNIVSTAPPAPQIIKITRAGNTSTIYFTTTNGLTYTLYYTNATGLTTSVTNWPSLSTTVAGNGLTNSIPDTTTDTNRFYRVGAH